MNDKKLRQKALKKIYEMAFSQNTDAFKLLYLSEEDMSALEGLDLGQVVSLHKAANGGVEIKLVDKAKLIAMLLEATAEDEGEARESEEAEGSGFIEALNNAAASLRAAREKGKGRALKARPGEYEKVSQ